MQSPALRIPPLTVVLGLPIAMLVGVGIAVFPPVALAVIGSLAVAYLLVLASRWPAPTGERRDRELAYYRILLWVLLINVPTFLEFDSSGLTHDHGLINTQSLARIAVTLLTVALFFLGWAVPMDRSPASATLSLAKVFALPIALYGWYAIDALVVSSGTDLLLALFRSGEWFLFLAITWKIFRRTGPCNRDRPADLLRNSLPVVFFPIVAILLVLPVMPSLVYQTSVATGLSRVGGLFTHPNVLAALSAMAFFYMAGTWNGWRKSAGMVLAVAIVIMTYSRSGLISLALVLPVSLFVRARSVQARVWIGIAACLLAIAIFFSDSILAGAKHYLQRGQSESNLATLSERTIVWEAAKIMINGSPILGTGFVAGPKGLADVMMTLSTASYFVAPNAHNELLQAQISGGVIATFLSLLLQTRIFFLWWRLRKTIGEPTRSISLSWMVLLAIYGTLHPTLSAQLGLVSGLFVSLYLWLEYLYQKSNWKNAPEVSGVAWSIQPGRLVAWRR